MSNKKEIIKKYGEIYNIIKYVQKEMQTFLEKPFSDEDSLVLAQACYMHFDTAFTKLTNIENGVKFSDMYKAELFEDIIDNTISKDENFALLSALCRSPRYRDIIIKNPIEITNEEMNEQFSATTFYLPTKQIYIGYRGTEATVIGWREDFDMLFEPAMQSQYTALEYLEKISQNSNNDIMIGGHSKGGAMALYRASCCCEKTRNKIIKVYNHDGPGLTKSAIENSNYSLIKPIINTTIPQQSLIGIIMNDGAYKVVYSDAWGISQHDPFSWQLSKDGFVWAESISRASDRMEEALDELIAELTEDEKRLVVNTVFKIVESTGETDFIEWPKSALKEYEKIIDTIKEFDEDTLKKIKSTVFTILKIVFRNMVDVETSEHVQSIEKSFLNIKNQIVKRFKTDTDNDDIVEL